MIPKPNRQIWRPITIDSILGRIFSSVLDRRIRRSIVQNIRQKGFTFENGCKINVELLDVALEQSKREKGDVYAIVDISKAFDMVPHSAIKPCPARKGISTPLIELISNMYKNCKTKIKAKDGAGVENEILRGVKQGDPLSLLLFNVCMERLLEGIGGKTEGIKTNEGSRIPILVFADDIVLLGNDKRKAQEQLSMVQDYLKSLGMSISGGKCLAFQLVSK